MEDILSVAESEIGYKGGFQGLDTWKVARDFRIKISELTKSFPSSEKFRLIDQLIRASRSITANIAEGYGRYHFQENIQFNRQARGSLMECLDHLICARDEEFISPVQFSELENSYKELLRLLNGYIAYLIRRKKEGS